MKLSSFKSLIILSSIYILLCGLISAIYLILILFNNIYQNDIIVWIGLILCSIVAITSIVNNILLLKAPLKAKKTRHLINMWINAFQTIYLISDGFQYRYNQGLEIVIFIDMNNTTKQVSVGSFFKNFNFFVDFKFLETANTLIGISMIPLFLTILSCYFFKKSKSV